MGGALGTARVFEYTSFMDRSRDRDDTPFMPHGGYRKLRSYVVAQAVYDATVVFCRRFYGHDRRMTDQMVQAAGSGVRNISEGSAAAANVMLCATHQACYLLRRQVKSQGRIFLKEGGFTENLYKKRQAARQKEKMSDGVRPGRTKSDEVGQRQTESEEVGRGRIASNETPNADTTP